MTKKGSSLVLIPLRETILFGPIGAGPEFFIGKLSVLIPLRETILFGLLLAMMVSAGPVVLIPLRETILFGLIAEVEAHAVPFVS